MLRKASSSPHSGRSSAASAATKSTNSSSTKEDLLQTCSVLLSPSSTPSLNALQKLRVAYDHPGIVCVRRWSSGTTPCCDIRSWPDRKMCGGLRQNWGKKKSKILIGFSKRLIFIVSSVGLIESHFTLVSGEILREILENTRKTKAAVPTLAWCRHNGDGGATNVPLKQHWKSSTLSYVVYSIFFCVFWCRKGNSYHKIGALIPMPNLKNW